NKLVAANRTEEAIELFEQSREELQAIVEERPNRDGQYSLAGVLSNLSRATWWVGDVERAQELAREALRWGNVVAEAQPRDPDYRHIRNWALLTVAVSVASDEEAGELAERAEADYQRLVADYPDNVVHKVHLVEALRAKGDALRRSQRWQE